MDDLRKHKAPIGGFMLDEVGLKNKPA